jgi:phage shock protein E
MNPKEIVQAKKGTIVDVRSPEEFRGGHVVGSINIPLQELQNRKEEIENLEMPLVLCCASGNRSGMAEQMLKLQDLKCCNGGSWLNVNKFQAESI